MTSEMTSEMTSARRHKAKLSVLAIVLGASLLGGCANFEPWVKPYERERLADPIMAFERDPVSAAYLYHVYESREGARGALGSAGGGCGCN